MNNKNCPVCDSNNVITEDLFGFNDVCKHAVCNDCGCSAPVDKWNMPRKKYEEAREARNRISAWSMLAYCSLDENSSVKDQDGYDEWLETVNELLKDEEVGQLLREHDTKVLFSMLDSIGSNITESKIREYAKKLKGGE